jgi:hypothetical protein
MPILFLAILTSSAKFFRPDLNLMLTEHLRIVINRAIVSEVCTIDMVQAICVCNFWKAPTDSIWLKIGIAIRLAYQLRLHEAKDAPPGSGELERRKAAVSEDFYSRWKYIGPSDMIAVYPQKGCSADLVL